MYRLATRHLARDIQTYRRIDRQTDRPTDDSIIMLIAQYDRLTTKADFEAAPFNFSVNADKSAF